MGAEQRYPIILGRYQRERLGPSYGRQDFPYPNSLIFRGCA